MKRYRFFRIWPRRLLALVLAVGTVWVVTVTAGSDTAEGAWTRLQKASPLAALRWELGDLWSQDGLSAAAVMAIAQSPLLLSARAEVERREVLTAVFIRSMRLAPKSWEITTLHPMLMPRATAM